jgi:hypothetical protein
MTGRTDLITTSESKPYTSDTDGNGEQPQGTTVTGQRPALYYSRGFTLSCCLRELSSGRFSIRSYGG